LYNADGYKEAFRRSFRIASMWQTGEEYEGTCSSIDRDTRYAHRILLKEHLGKAESGITFRWNPGK
jgi:hypothetical protein